MPSFHVTHLILLRMHSSLQAEVRLTRKLIGSSCQYCSRRPNSPRRPFHRSRDLRSSQGARHDGSSRAPPPSEKDKDHKREPEDLILPNPTDYTLPPAVAQQFFRHEGPPDDSSQPPPTTFYGSGVNRRQRLRVSKEQSEPVPATPEWFKEYNVTLSGEGRASTFEDYVDPSASSADETQQQNPTPDGNSTDPQTVLLQLSPVASKEGPEPKSSPKFKAFGASEETRKAVSDPRLRPSRYYIDVFQDLEIRATVRGLLRLPFSREFQDEPASKTNHLLLLYAAKNGELLLDEYVRSLSQQLNSDLITFDVQDIAELIRAAQKGPEITKNARMLSYEVSGPRIKSSVVGDAVESSFEQEDIEDEDDTDAIDLPNGRSPLGMPIMLGKIDLGNIFGRNMFDNRRGSGRRRGFQSPADIFSDLLPSVNQKVQPDPAPLSGLVESLLSEVQNRRFKKAQSVGDKQMHKSVDSAIIHVKDSRALQEHKLGEQFMQELFAQVEKRRTNGEHIAIIGTECEELDPLDLPSSQFDNVQRTKDSDMSRAIVITPCFPKALQKGDMIRDFERKRVAVNLRHIWEMARLKNKENFLGLQPGFWKGDLSDKVSKDDWHLLSGRWTFSRVHRICSILDGTMTPASLTCLTVDHPQRPEERIGILSLIEEWLKQSDESKLKWADKQQQRDRNTMPQLQRPKPEEDSRFSMIRASASKHEKKLMTGIIEADKISTTFEEVHAPEVTIDALQTLTMLSITRADAFQYGVLKSDRIPGLLLYGPPGTGKTLLAKAVAKESGATMLEVSAAEINDMYVGEGEKNVKALFSLAKKLSPCVVFLDEADALFSARSTSGRRVSHRELLNQFLKEWDGMSNDSGSAFIMVATNRPMDLDDAVLRRLPRRLLIDLPSEADRLEILKIHLRNEQLAADVSLPDLAKNTPFYSGSDLKNVAVAAALSAVREESEAFKKHTEDEAYQYPEKRTLTKSHFDKALEEVSASISEDMTSLRDIKKFDEQYGDKRGKKKAKKWGFRTVEEGGDTVKVRN